MQSIAASLAMVGTEQVLLTSVILGSYALTWGRWQNGMDAGAR
jgi:hypothetical protein